MSALDIIRGNADLLPAAGEHALPEPSVDLFPERDDLLDPEMILASHAYGARLRATPLPDAPEVLA